MRQHSGFLGISSEVSTVVSVFVYTLNLYNTVFFVCVWERWGEEGTSLIQLRLASNLSWAEVELEPLPSRVLGLQAQCQPEILN